MTHPFEKHLIVNGSINPSISDEELIEHFGQEEWLTVAHYTQVEMNVYHKVESKYKYEELKTDTRARMLELRKTLRNLEAEKRQELDDKDFKEGAAIYNFLGSTRCVGAHQLHFSPSQAKGYISQSSSWNNFNPDKMIDVINEIEGLNFRCDYGINNPNSGREVFSWRSYRDYWILVVKIGGETLNNLRQILPQIEAIMMKANPSVVRLDTSNEKSGEVEVVMWWD